jgi:thiamine biosynthesis lipoprotein
MKKVVLIAAAAGLFACNTIEQKQPISSEDIVKIEGEAQGTTYHISYIGEADADSTKHDIDSILVDVDNSLSTWVPTSLISEINQLDTSTITFDDHFNYFSEVFKYSREVYQLTDGAFDPTIGPL